MAVLVFQFHFVMRCRDKGKTVPAADILVAACAAYHKVELEHKDGHFEIILPLAKSL